MRRETGREALRQYLRYFRIWFVVAGVMLLLCVALCAVRYAKNPRRERENSKSPAERVYDYADVLSDGEENELSGLIAEAEKRAQCDIVLVTICEPVGQSDQEWERTMRDMADDFYDGHNYGYEGAQGSGVLLMDNWYDGESGSYLTTCGTAYDRFGLRDIDDVLDAVNRRLPQDPFGAYRKYVEKIAEKMSEGELRRPSALLLLIPLAAMFVFVVVKLKTRMGGETEAAPAKTYLTAEGERFRVRSDTLEGTYVTRRHIPRPSEGAGSRGSSGYGGRGGGHVSRGGVSHGGGGRRR